MDGLSIFHKRDMRAGGRGGVLGSGSSSVPRIFHGQHIVSPKGRAWRPWTLISLSACVVVHQKLAVEAI